MTEPPVHYRTSDLGVAAALVVAGYPLLATERDRRRVSFGFAAGDGLPAAVAAYHRGDLVVSARRMSDELRSLRALIAASLRETEAQAGDDVSPQREEEAP